MSKLAIHGGKKAVPEGAIKKWPPIEDVDREMVLASLEGGHHAFGPNCEAFEKEFAAWNGSRFAITTNSGTAALHLAVAACGLGAGDHVLVPAYSWSSSATCVIHHNCIPVFVDIDYDTMNIDVDRLEAAITPRTRAVIAVHLHGLAVNMDKVLDAARRHGLKVIEDACQSHGALFKGRKTGTMGDCGAFSLNQNKSLCSGEGGFLVTDDEELYKAARRTWSFGETRTPLEKRDYHAYALGWMYRNNDLTAAFGRAQLKRLDRFIEIQIANAAALTREIKDIKGLIAPHVPEGHSHTFYNYTMHVDPDALGWNGDTARFRDALLRAIQAEGVPAHIWQRYSLPEMAVFADQNAYGRGCPWSCKYTEPVEYRVEDYPEALRHCATHFGLTMPLRAPNGPEVAQLMGQALRKVCDNIAGIDPDEILKNDELYNAHPAQVIDNG